MYSQEHNTFPVTDKLAAIISADVCDAVRLTELSISFTVFTIPDRLNTDCDTDIALLYAESDFIDTLFNQSVVLCKLDETVSRIPLDDQYLK